MSIEYTLPLSIRASLSVILEDGTVTRQQIDEAIDHFNHQWQNHAVITFGPATIYADCLGPRDNDYRGQSFDKVTNETGSFDLRTDEEKAEHLEGIEALLQELLSFQSEHFDAGAHAAKPEDLLEFFIDWRRRARKAIENKR
jgi:hypothetical protein